MAVEVVLLSLGTKETDTRRWPNSASDLAAAASSDKNSSERESRSLQRLVSRECVSWVNEGLIGTVHRGREAAAAMALL